MTVKNEQNETIILTPEQEAIKRLENKLNESEEETQKFKDLIEEIKNIVSKNTNQKMYNFLSYVYSLQSYAITVIDLLKNK